MFFNLNNLNLLTNNMLEADTTTARSKKNNNTVINFGSPKKSNLSMLHETINNSNKQGANNENNVSILSLLPPSYRHIIEELESRHTNSTKNVEDFQNIS